MIFIISFEAIINFRLKETVIHSISDILYHLNLKFLTINSIIQALHNKMNILTTNHQ